MSARIPGQIQQRPRNPTTNTSPVAFPSGGFYGAGLYLAENARYSNDDRYVHHVAAAPSLFRRSARRQLLLCRAALGTPFDFGDVIDRSTKSLQKPPAESPGVLYDSVRGGPHRPTCSGPGDDDSAMFVLYDLAQVM